ncbi:Ger(x)C family spore germination protein [Paenibacillus sp. KS-LC4]|uniref:Ger(x)C family spore germination protein n=1 Tax=Paenibacillus sp. KS-LC4 TaxID=2979727 RepID=UPI0030D28DE3
MHISHIVKRSLLIAVCAVVLPLQTGCWSKDEIEDQSIYVGMGLDPASETELEKKLRSMGSDYLKRKLLTYTLQIINVQSESQHSGGQAPTSQKPYYNISETGDSMFQLIREFATRMERPVIGHHLKVIVINEKLLRKYSMNELLDFFLRDNDIRPSCLVLISKGSARSSLVAKDKAIIPSFRLAGLVDNRYRSLNILEPMTLSKLEGKMYGEQSYLLQNIIAAEGEVKFSGGAVIKGKTQKIQGLLTEEETTGCVWLTGKGEGGLVKSYYEDSHQPIVYEVKSMKSDIDAKVAGDQISFHISIKSQGRLIEEWLNNNEPIDPAFKKQAEEGAQKEVRRLTDKALKKVQQKYGTDVLGLGKQFSIQHPRMWEKIKGRWEELFPEIPITVSIEMEITEYGGKITR